MASPIIAETIRSKRGKDKLVLFGFIYTLNRSTEDFLYWVCEKRGQCKARLTTRSDLVVVKPSDLLEIQETHTHGCDKPRIEMLKGYNQMKERASQNSAESTRSIFASGVATMGTSSLVQLPKTESIKQTVRKSKNGLEGLDNPAYASDLQILERYKVTSKGESFLLFDSGLGDDNRILMFGTPKMVSILATSRSWYADGTFKVAPQQFYQIYTIHAEIDGYIFPCIYVLVTHKDEITYNRMFRKLLELEPELNPLYVMVDFEKAAINALEEQFLAVISGCFFHLSQNIFRHMQSLGLTTQYMDDPEFAIYMRMLPSLAFVPENEVCDCFTILMGEFPQSARELADYFETNYIGRRLPNQTRRVPRFPMRFWNMHERVLNKKARTNNSVEGWHNAFQSGISIHHPSFPKLMNYLEREQSLQEVKYAKLEIYLVKPS